MKKIIVDPGLIDSLEVGDAVMDWDREKSSVTDEDGNVVGYIDLNDGKMIHVWLYEDGESGHSPDAAKRQELSDEEVLAMWRRGELVVRIGRIHHGNLCVCPEKGDGEWCDKCEGYALEQGQ